MKIKRLKKLIEFMQKMPAEKARHFNMSGWVEHHGGEHSHGFVEAAEVKAQQLTSCGTAACALGWATTIPSFRRLGMRLIYDGCIGEVKLKDDPMSDSTSVGEKIFGLDYHQFNALFATNAACRMRTPKKWAARARKLVARWA